MSGLVVDTVGGRTRKQLVGEGAKGREHQQMDHHHHSANVGLKNNLHIQTPNTTDEDDDI